MSNAPSPESREGREKMKCVPECTCARTPKYRHRCAFQGPRRGGLTQEGLGLQKHWKKGLSPDLKGGPPHGAASFPLPLGPKGLSAGGSGLSQL